MSINPQRQEAGATPLPGQPTSSASDFDFFTGNWSIRNRKLKTRLQQCTEWEEFTATDTVIKVLNGLGNFGQWGALINDEPFAGLTLRLFDPQTRLWSIYWSDSNTGTLDTPVQGCFSGGVGTFYGKDVLRGQEVDVRFTWDATDPQHPVWSQAFSEDGGENWETNWYMYHSRL
ncbi:hypothetical protein [Chitinophaga barathri]|uniref:DUF1579 domain-containing protein n=1 Tax=Chitinophaga barathri TaxID=1647451 RepID=A0A3N4M982_9BACT|nr:hypothetical protein [Chitinophaga barathri]RPD39988.1 hypothetical protein EG028_17865 [Chitinophaga barathri]